MALFWGIGLLLGYKIFGDLMGWFGRILWRGPWLKRSNQIARANLKMVFPEKSLEEIETILEEVWDNLARLVADYMYFKSMDIRNPNSFEIRGEEHLQALREDEKPGILMAGHLANWGIVSIAALQGGLPISQIYRRFNNPIADWMIKNSQVQGGMKVLWKGSDGGKKAYKVLKKGGHLVVFIDQKMNEGIPVPFFGREAMTATAPARLALKLNCPIVPVRVERIEGIKFRVTYYPPVKIEPSGDIHKDIYAVMLQINGLLEAWIRERPGQWLWVHSRWPKKK